MTRRFDQYCPMAHALSLVGERWSLLIVRELLHGPKRYTDLAHGLPGIGTNILAARLRDLEGCGVVQKRKLPPPAASTVYELTEYGTGLREPLYALARWGARTLDPPSTDTELYEEWGLNALAALFDPEAARGLTETYVLEVGGDAFTARLEDGRLEVAIGAAEGADVVLETDLETFYELAVRDLDPHEALESGRARAEGDQAAVERCLRVLSLARPVGAAA